MFLQKFFVVGSRMDFGNIVLNGWKIYMTADLKRFHPNRSSVFQTFCCETFLRKRYQFQEKIFTFNLFDQIYYSIPLRSRLEIFLRLAALSVRLICDLLSTQDLIAKSLFSVHVHTSITLQNLKNICSLHVSVALRVTTHTSCTNAVIFCSVSSWKYHHQISYNLLNL